MITKEQWVDWKNSPVTQSYLKSLVDKREQLKEGWARGEAENERQDCITQGRTQGLTDAVKYAVRDFDYIEIEGEPIDGTESDSISSYT